MTSLDIIAIIVLSAIVFTTGMLFAGKGKSMQGFFGAGGAVPWYISGLSLFMGFFSAGTFVVWGSIAYAQGLVAISIQWTMALAGLFVGLFIAPRWNHVKPVTVAAYLQERFGNKVQKAYSYLFMAIAVFTSGAFLYPVARIVSTAADWPLSTCIIALGLISVVYVSVGGLWAVMITDVLQFIILFSAVLAVLILSIQKVPATAELIQQLPAGFTNFLSDEYTGLFLAAFMVYNLIFLGGNWSYVQRYTNVANPAQARKVGLLFGALYIISPVLWMLPPILYRYLEPGLAGLQTESAYLLMCRQILPSGLLGLMLGGMVFATASSLNGNLNILSGVFTNDVFKRWYPHASKKQLMMVARVSSFLFGLLAIAVALSVQYMGGIVNVVLSIAAITGAPLYLPIIWSLFFKKISGQQVLTVTMASLLINITLKLGAPYVGLPYPRTMEMLVGVLIPLLLLAATQLYEAKATLPASINIPANEQVESTSLTSPIQENSPNPSDNHYGLRVLGIAVIATGLFICTLSFFTTSHSNIPLGIGGFQILLGLVVWKKHS